MMGKGTLTVGAFALVAVGGLLWVGCGEKAGSTATSGTATQGGTASGGGNLSGEVSADGSSTVSPIMEAVAEEFGKTQPDVKPTVATSGTGGGFKKFSAGEIDIANASRPIKDEEIEACKKNGIEFVEIPVAFDGLSVVVHPSNGFATDLTVAELKKIWSPDTAAKTWADVRPGFPAEKIKLYGPGTDSGTFDYFTDEIVGEEGKSRKDYQQSEDDNVLVTGVSGDEFSLGYFGYAYYEQNKDKLKLVAIDGITPSPETIANGTYKPLSRPLLLYVNKKSLEEKPAVGAMLRYLMTEGKELITSVGYVPLPDEAYTLALERLEKKTTGSAFRGVKGGTPIEDVLKGKTGA